MSLLVRVRTLWQVPGGGSGLTQWYFTMNIVPPTDYNALNVMSKAFFTAIRVDPAPGITWNWEPELAVVDDATGVISHYVDSAVPTQETSAGNGAYAAPAGGKVAWRTAAVVRGRRLVGQTFIVPLCGQALDANGTIAAATVTRLRNAADALLSAAAANATPLRVWSRPNPDEGIPVGTSAPVATASVPDKAVVLRSRRD